MFTSTRFLANRKPWLIFELTEAQYHILQCLQRGPLSIRRFDAGELAPLFNRHLVRIRYRGRKVDLSIVGKGLLGAIYVLAHDVPSGGQGKLVAFPRIKRTA